jgi:hypothetical protein
MHQNYMNGRKTHRTELSASSSEFLNLSGVYRIEKVDVHQCI